MDGRIRKVWVETPEEGNPNWLEFRVADEWYSTGGQKVTMPVKVLAKHGEHEERTDGGAYLAILDQFGGAELLLDIMEAGGLEQGAEYRLEVYPDGDRRLVEQQNTSDLNDAAQEVVDDE